MSNIAVHLEEGSQTFASRSKVRELVKMRLKPFGQTRPRRHVSKPRVKEDDSPMVSRVSDDSTHSLICGSESLELIPFLSRHCGRGAAFPLVIQKLPLELDPGVLEGRVGEPSDQHSPAAIISKVQALGNLFLEKNNYTK